jgi:hypothetical protein
MKYGKGFLFAAAIILVLEIVVRIAFADNISGRFEYGYHPTAGFVEKGDTLHLVRAGGRRFREQSLPIRKDPGKLRIFTVGGSVPRGPSLKGAYAFQLRGILEDRGIQAESYNLAIAGFGARRKHITLKGSLKYDPDIVIIHLNHSNEFEDEREYNRSLEFKKIHPKNILMRSFVLRRVYELKTEKIFWKWLPEEIRRTQALTDFDMEVRAGMDENTTRIWNRRIAEMLDQDVRATREAGAKAVIVVQAIWGSENNEGPPRLIRNDYLEELAASHTGKDVRVVSMYDVFQDTDPSEHFADGAHLRASGHRLIAEQISTEVLSLLEQGATQEEP